ncbi:zinc finger BED domain-containing protein RICESLEEPER 3-like isoform X2 [Melanotaenia boesemani]|uniref:zinc finger BED domain-containing protein RICESLEEPER 3-like isoform X2 n=1 Tax=Melanotaenia boesemani TaxID=1250792 RepID=UPI001C04C259|nr:zinc finger BED domain-containing protein RICESLEEPER 3-like isoform X2 [Melanotaenia boesemani]
MMLNWIQIDTTELDSSRSQRKMSKTDIMRGVITEKLTTAAREIFAAMEKTVADYEEEASVFRQEIDRQKKQLELLQPVEIKVEPTDDQQLFSLCEAGGGEVPEKEEKHKYELRVEDSRSLRIFNTEEPMEEDDNTEEELQENETRCQMSDQQNHIVLRIRILEDTEIEVLSIQIIKKYPLRELRCPCGLQEADFVNLLRSTFPQLAADGPFDLFITNKSRKLQPLEVDSFTPEQICMAAGNSSLYIRLKRPGQVQSRQKEPMQNSEEEDDDEEDDSDEEEEDDDDDEYEDSPSAHHRPKLNTKHDVRYKLSKHRPLEATTKNLINLRIRILEDSSVEVITPRVYNKYPLHYLSCPRGLREAEFLYMLRSTYPQLAGDQPFIVLARKGRKIKPLGIECLTPEEILRTSRSVGSPVVYIRLEPRVKREATDPRSNHAQYQGNSSLQSDERKSNHVDLRIRFQEEQSADMLTFAKKRGRSQMWDYFQLVSPNKVKCLLCPQVLSYSNNTSSMLRHFKAKHDDRHEHIDHVDRKQELDEALINMLVKDSQPFSMVDDQGFKEFVGKLDPSYILPPRQTLKKMVGEKYEEEKTKAKTQLQTVKGVSLTSDMWTSVKMDVCLAVRCHYMLDSAKPAMVVLGVLPFPQHPTAENMAAATRSLMMEWGIEGKVKCLVTDATTNMIDTAGNLAISHIVCIAHALNSMVKKSLDQTPGLEDLRSRAQEVVTYFRSNTAAKEKLRNVQQQMNRAATKLIQEVDSRWNSTFLMLQRLYDEREAVGAALATLKTEVHPLSSGDYETTAACLHVLKPFYMATEEMSQQKMVSGSMVIPLIKMLLHTTQEILSNNTNVTAKLLGQNITAALRDKFDDLESSAVLSLCTLLDPRFKTIGFRSQDEAENAVERLTTECAALMGHKSTDYPSTSVPTHLNPSSRAFDLWKSFDEQATMSITHRNSTVNATAEVQKYMKDVHLERCEDPLAYWNEQRKVYPHLFSLAKQYLCTPASSVSCEHLFSKAGDVLSEKRSRLSPKTVEKILFLNKNL